MSKPTWPASLTQTLRHLQRHDGSLRIAIVGIGNEFCGDDVAGLAVARTLQPLAAEADQVLVIDAGPAPENFTGLLRRFGPDLVLLVDAAQMDESPGVVRWLKWQDTRGLSASTHTLPSYVLARYLSAELGCQVALIGIQPSDVTVDRRLSPKVKKGVEAIVNKLQAILL